MLEQVKMAYAVTYRHSTYPILKCRRSHTQFIWRKFIRLLRHVQQVVASMIPTKIHVRTILKPNILHWLASTAQHPTPNCATTGVDTFVIKIAKVRHQIFLISERQIVLVFFMSRTILDHTTKLTFISVGGGLAPICHYNT